MDIKGTCFSEYWMGDHPDGKSEMLVDRYDFRHYKLLYDNSFMARHAEAGKPVSISDLFAKEPKKFLG